MALFKTIHTIRFETIDSTHSWGKKNIYSFDPDALTCVTALEQTGGIGRHMRKWISPFGLNIYTSLCFSLPTSSKAIGNLGQLLSLSAATVLEGYGFTPEIKWPNDIRVQGKKIAGVLGETFTVEKGAFAQRTAAVISIGFNVNMPGDLLSAVDQPATSLAQVSGRSWDLKQVHDAIVQEFVCELALLQEQGFAPFREKYQHLLAFKGQSISYFDGKKSVEGICRGILSDGRLELLLPNQESILLSSGEIYLL
ncbi:MAG TPA: biotin--[acetyl-CoA-carboxylase] ligase [Rhabdochlamydiaceae bacterium]|jgi:BirA family biotin operon repressor/biotin-[acetyl-CoA-carboxylase] ligase